MRFPASLGLCELERETLCKHEKYIYREWNVYFQMENKYSHII